jgi:pimeloyl-ACP methyl ester carboxylesterase
LVWGKQDEITPPFVAEKFEELLPNATLVFLDKCGHAAMMEQPKAFNEAFASFIEQF